MLIKPMPFLIFCSVVERQFTIKSMLAGPNVWAWVGANRTDTLDNLGIEQVLLQGMQAAQFEALGGIPGNQFTGKEGPTLEDVCAKLRSMVTDRIDLEKMLDQLYEIKSCTKEIQIMFSVQVRVPLPKRPGSACPTLPCGSTGGTI